MTPSNNKKPFDAFMFEIQVRLATAVKIRMKEDQVQLDRLVDRLIDRMFLVLSKQNGGTFIGSPEQLSNWGVNWKPLGQKYNQGKSEFKRQTNAQKKVKKADKKAPITFYNNMGDLIRDMRGKSNKSSVQSMSQIMGGMRIKGYELKNKENYSYGSNRKETIRDIRSGKIQKTSVKQVVKIELMGKLKNMNKPELIFGLENEKKLGLINGKYASWHRPFIKQYAYWYARNIIIPEIRNYVLRRQK